MTYLKPTFETSVCACHRRRTVSLGYHCYSFNGRHHRHITVARGAAVCWCVLETISPLSIIVTSMTFTFQCVQQVSVSFFVCSCYLHTLLWVSDDRFHRPCRILWWLLQFRAVCGAGDSCAYACALHAAAKIKLCMLTMAEYTCIQRVLKSSRPYRYCHRMSNVTAC